MNHRFFKTCISFLLLSSSCFGVFMFIQHTDVFQKNMQYNEKSMQISFILDVSQSMNIQDMSGGISRLDKAKNIIKKIAEELPSAYISLTIFAWEGVNILPPTQDKNILYSYLGSISHTNIYTQGSRLDTWIDAFLHQNFHKTAWELIILTDQDSWEWKIFTSVLPKQKQELQKYWLKPILVGVWSENGWRIPLWVNVFWKMQYKMYDWQYVTSPLEEDYLKEITNRLWGIYIWAENIEKILDTIQGDSFLYSNTIEKEMLYIFLSGCCLLLCIFTLFFKKHILYEV